ncbi:MULTISPECIES: hypothetical protein [Sphingomonadaceae]|mgnify:FL=1|uniref:hypothetical protein n=1 Tax=Sphingomonadales TaxID=204457 RepID=UPI000731ACB0|nr:MULTISPECIES: hypothetical protein [Sphingomonadaceae]KTE51820.1 hypothetical protein ATE69_16000 [Sphingopyxis sp. H071]KTE58385.1 hypothetical protein ATE66_15365 [Sphingopyxis sp. H107]KTE72973.1 hypothetical protein ATE60_07860 [Sphingopyxis sp. H081]KTE24809.1 hypothetical protein ATE61_12980 [Sphingopyxis sp. H057]KTE50834.1 hypothetical protein ATE64_16055 [Sphingopyxis sp. H073]
MASQALRATPGTWAERLRPLLREQHPWQKFLSLGLSLALLAALGSKLATIGFSELLRGIPASPIFWIAFAAYYLALPASEWLIFRRLWNIPPAGFAALLRKLVSNEILFGYSGEAYFYGWARRHAKMAAAPFGAIKDVSILSAVAGNLMTLVMLALAWPVVGQIAPEFHGRTVALSAAVIIGLSLALLAFRQRIFSLPRTELRMIFGMHIGRLLLTTFLSGVMWHSALPSVSMGWLLILATLQLLVTRLPFVPNKDIVFASVALFLIGHDGAIGALIAMIAGLILLLHLLLGAILTMAELATAHRS